MREINPATDDILRLDYFAAIDRQFADFLATRFNGNDQTRLLFALISSAHRAGHSCFRLSAVRELPFYDEFRRELDNLAAAEFSSPAIGPPGAYRPIINNDDKWYLHRYHHYEDNIAGRIKQRLKFGSGLNYDLVRERLDYYFGPATEPDWQRIAAALAVCGNFTIISGGPGTGKTTTVAKILAILLELNPELKGRVAIAAPTGKAAARLQESLKAARAEQNFDIPDDTSTIHRLLGTTSGKSKFRHNRDNRLALELVIVDEVSMVDLSLMSNLLDAVPDTARLILLGDRDQLASVNPGSVLAELCGAGEINAFSRAGAELLARTGNGRAITILDDMVPPLRDHVVQLRKSYRYPPHSGIAKVAPLINHGRGREAITAMTKENSTDIRLLPLAELENGLRKLAMEFYPLYLREKEPGKIFSAFGRFRVLAAVRRGSCGVGAINAFIENTLAAMGLIEPEATPWYHGRPIMVTRNDYSVRLFNGDTGIMLHDEEQGRLLAFFQGTDGNFRKIPPARLPEHETVFAMTVHKSQGSEYAHIALVLPENESPVVSRELLYTAITRAKKSVTVFAEESVFIKEIHSRTRRMSGLGEKLWGHGIKL